MVRGRALPVVDCKASSMVVRRRAGPWLDVLTVVVVDGVGWLVVVRSLALPWVTVDGGNGFSVVVGVGVVGATVGIILPPVVVRTRAGRCVRVFG